MKKIKNGSLLKVIEKIVIVTDGIWVNFIELIIHGKKALLECNGF